MMLDLSYCIYLYTNSLTKMHSNLCRQSPPSFFCLLGHYCIHWPCLFPCFHYPFSALSGTSTHYVVRTMPLLPSKLMVRLSPGAGTAMRFVASFEARFRDFTANIWFCTSCFSGNEIKLKIWNYKCFFVEIFLDIYIYTSYISFKKKTVPHLRFFLPPQHVRKIVFAVFSRES